MNAEHHADRDDREYHELVDRIAEERSIANAARRYVEEQRNITRGSE